MQRYLLMVWIAGLFLTVFLAGLGIFETTIHSTLTNGSTKLVESNKLDPHRAAGSLLILIALLVMIAGLVARQSGRQTGMSVTFGVLAIVQMFLAGAGSDSGAFWGGLHVLNAFALTGLAFGLLALDTKLLRDGDAAAPAAGSPYPPA